jgi:predicted ATPase
VHLAIGRLLVANTVAAELEAALFSIVHHFNAAGELLKSASERIEVAELNLKAGQKARSAAAYAEGLRYAEHGLALLGAGSWQDDYDLTLALHNEAAELAYLSGDYDKLDEIERHIHKNAQSILDRTNVYQIRINADIIQADYLAAIEIGVRTLFG